MPDRSRQTPSIEPTEASPVWVPLDDPHRPAYHLLPPAGWMNDPNGLLEYEGKIHLFYQHNPNGAFHDCIHWGHAVSGDLVHWEHLPIALAPTPGGPDADGCWSGCAVVYEGIPTLVYTGASPQVQCLATTNDRMITWHKDPANPIIASPPHGVDIVGNPPELRDPWVWQEKDEWHMLLGSGVRTGETDDSTAPEGVLLLYRSYDLRAWEYVGIAHRGRFAEDAAIWECPNLFVLDGRHVLLVSEQHEFTHTYYQVGSFDGRRFDPERTGKTDHGKYFYAALTTETSDDRRLMWGWLKEGRAEAAQRSAGWAGVMSLPRILELHDDGTPSMRPVPELEALRERPHRIESRTLRPGQQIDIPELAGDALELHLKARVPAGAVLTLGLRRSGDGSEETVIRYAGGAREIHLDTSRSSLSPEAHAETVVATHPSPEGTVDLRVFLDRSVIELFADQRTCLTGRIYPTCHDSLGVYLRAEGEKVELVDFEGWHMRSIW